jgi:hypothetical protein
MRASSSMISRTLLVIVALLWCTSASGPRAFGSVPHPASVQTTSIDGSAQIAPAASPDFSVQIAPSPLMIVYQVFSTGLEGDAEGGVTVTGTNGFAGQVDVTCSITPPAFDEPVCFLFANPVSVDASGPPSVAPLDVSSSAPDCEPSPISSRLLKFPSDPGWRARSETATILLVLLICLTMVLPSEQHAKALRAGFLCFAVLVMAGCGSASGKSDPCGVGNFDPGTPPGTYMVTITATSGNITHTATVPLIVPPTN